VKKVEKDVRGPYTVGSSQVTAVIVLGQGWRIYETRAHNGTRKDFLGMRHSMMSHFFIFLPDQRLYIGKNMCICTHIWLRTGYINYRCYQIILGVKHFYRNRERCEVVTAYLSLGRQP